MHPSVQDEMYKEIQEICGNKPPSFAEVPSMIYTLCVAYESMRLFPVVGTLPHRTENDQVLLGKHFIPKNTCIGPDMVALGRNGTYWGDTCDEFNPSRFDNRHPEDHAKPPADWTTIMDGKIKTPMKGAFFAFGEGPRVCLGNYLIPFIGQEMLIS